MARKPTDIVSLSLRIREGLRRRLAREAKNRNQSLNAEIADRLDQSFQLAERQAQYDVLLSFATAGNKDDARLLKLIASAMWKLRTGPKRLTDQEYADRLTFAINWIIAEVARLPSWHPGAGRQILRTAWRAIGRRVPGELSEMPADAEALLVAQAVLNLDGFKPGRPALVAEARRLKQLDESDQEKPEQPPAEEPEEK